MDKGSIGSGVGKETVDQIIARSDIISKNDKTATEMLLLNGNTPWIMLRSSVNRFTGGKIRRLKEDGRGYYTRDLTSLDELMQDPDKILKVDFKTTNQEAKNFILSSGTRTTEGGRQGISFKPGTLDSGKLYSNTSKLGFRPMPGITGCNIKSKNTYGTLLEAEVKFVVWTLEEMEMCELLYFRPGYTALLEWGHSIWVDSSDMSVPKIRETGGEYMTIPDSEFFQESSFKELDKKINKNRAKFCGNYDGIFGFITNFSFSLRPDMGYDCTVKIVSRGVILEGLKVFPVSSVGKVKSKEEQPVTRSMKSLFHYVFSILEQDFDANKGTGEVESEKETKKIEKSLSGQNMSVTIDYNQEKKDLLGSHYRSGAVTSKDRRFNGKKHLEAHYKTTSEGAPKLYTMVDNFMVFQSDIKMEGMESEGRIERINYIRLGDFLMLVNRFNSIKGLQEGDSLLKFRLKEGQKFETFDNHYSLDPFVAILPKPPKDQGATLQGLELQERTQQALKASGTDTKGGGTMRASTVDQSSFKVSEANLTNRNCQFRGEHHKTMKTHAILLGGTDEILNIYVSTRMIEMELDKVLQDDSRETGLYEAITGILQRVETALGGINNFNIANNSLNNILEVVDREFTGFGKEEVPEIDLTGLRSTMKEINISSTVSSQVATQVAIAAQGNVNSASENLGVLLEWNAGAIDRHMPVKYLGVSTESELERKGEYIKNLERAYLMINSDGKYDSELFNNIRSEGLNDIQSLYKVKNVEAKATVRGVVPVELSLKLLGIHGFVVGSAFRIKPGILPRKYDDWGYITTGLEHNIETTGNWTTTIKTQFYSVRNVEGVPISSGSSKDESEVVLVKGEETSRLLEDVGDPAPIINPRRIGSESYDKSPLGRKIVNSGLKAGQLPNSELLPIGLKKGDYKLHKQAFGSFKLWMNAMEAADIPYTISSAYRDKKRNDAAGGASNSPHMYGGTVDFSNLYHIVGGKTDPERNLEGRKKSEAYKQIASLGAKFNWYNPWRLSDLSGVDEMWHFEYWGPA